MSGTAKLVALALIVAALAWPAAALAACWTHADAGAPMNCPHCPAMAQHSGVGNRMVAAAPAGSCCQMSSGKPAPASAVSVPVNATQAGIVLAKTAAPILVAAEPPLRAGVVEAPAPDTSPQAVLCTFLI